MPAVRSGTEHRSSRERRRTNHGWHQHRGVLLVRPHSPLHQWDGEPLQHLLPRPMQDVGTVHVGDFAADNYLCLRALYDTNHPGRAFSAASSALLSSASAKRSRVEQSAVSTGYRHRQHVPGSPSRSPEYSWIVLWIPQGDKHAPMRLRAQKRT